jgi:hypothetical protein
VLNCIRVSSTTDVLASAELVIEHILTALFRECLLKDGVFTERVEQPV